MPSFLQGISKLRLAMIIIGSLLLLGIIALALTPTPEEQSAQTPIPPTSDTSTSSGSRLGNLANDIPEFSVVPTQETGVLEGTFTYLYENDIPEDFKVCAVNQQTFKEICTTEFIEHSYYVYGIGYRLEVPPGEYTVYAQAPREDFRSYYTPFVECGHRDGCDDHTPYRVSVSAGQVKENVNPNDWVESPKYQ